MKKLIKIFSWFIVIIVLLVIALTVVAKLAENKITDIALRKISESIEAPVEIEHVSFNLLRKFPLATIELHDVLLGAHNIPGSSDSVLTKMDTIARIGKIYVSVKSKPLLNGNIEIIKVDIESAVLNYSVDTSGISNFDFLMSSNENPEADTLPSKPLNVSLTDLSLKNINCYYNDQKLKASAKIKIPMIKVKANIEGENIIASLYGDLSLSDCSFEETNLYLMNNADLNFDIDYENDSISIKRLEIITDGANLDLLGSVVLGDAIKTEIKLKGSNLILSELIKYAPKEMLQEYGLQRIAGKMILDGNVKGVYSDTEMPRVDLKLECLNGNMVTRDYPALKNISFKGKVTNGILQNNNSTQADFSSFHFETKQSKFDVDFSVLDLDHPKYDIKTNMNIQVGEFKNFIPDSLVNFINGNIIASLSTKGELPDSIGDDFIDYIMANSTADINLSNFNVDLFSSMSVKNLSSKIVYKPNSLKVNNLNIKIPTYNVELKNTSFNTDFEGSINNTAELKLNIKSYHIESKGSIVTGYAKISNLDNPSYEFESKIETNLDEAKAMLPDSLLKTLKGNVVLNVRSKAKLNLDSLSYQVMDIVFKNSSYDLSMKDVYAELFDEPLYKIENLSGNMNMNPKSITINQLNGIAAGIVFAIDSTEIWNTYEVLIQGNENKFFTVQTNIVLGEINNKLISAFMIQDKATQDSDVSDLSAQNSGINSSVADSLSSVYLLPNFKKLGVPHFLVRGKLAVNRVEFEKNIIDDISLKFRFTDSLYVLDEFKLKTCDGEFNTSLKLDARKWDKPVVDVKSYITNLDIKKLLMLNDNFGDTLLTYEKVNGILTSEFHLRAFYENGSWPTERIRAQGHFTVENGYLYGYEPLVDLSKNKLIGGLKELDKLDFNTLTTSIFMFKDKIFIPKTDIVTSSMDITAFAMHSLKGDYEYHLELHLKDVLAGKSQKLIKDQAKQNKKDGSTLERNGLKFYSLKNGDKKKNWFDNDDLEKAFRNDLNKQQGFLNFSFRPLLVNFSTDLDRTSAYKDILDENKEIE